MKLAETADTLFHARIRDRNPANLLPEYGRGTQNEMVLDFMALAIAIIACKRGMPPGNESDMVPHALIPGA